MGVIANGTNYPRQLYICIGIKNCAMELQGLIYESDIICLFDILLTLFFTHYNMLKLVDVDKTLSIYLS